MGLFGVKSHDIPGVHIGRNLRVHMRLLFAVTSIGGYIVVAEWKTEGREVHWVVSSERDASKYKVSSCLRTSRVGKSAVFQEGGILGGIGLVKPDKGLNIPSKLGW